MKPRVNPAWIGLPRRSGAPERGACIGGVGLNLGQGSLVDQGALLDTGVESRSDLQLSGAHCQFVNELVVDGFLRVEAIGAHAGLACIAVFGRQRSLDRRIEVGVVEHDERGVAAQLE